MMTTLAFDIYGTLIDTHGVRQALATLVGDKATAFSQLWRDKQLEYTFRRGLMRLHADFTVCTQQALAYTNAALQTGLSPDAQSHLMTLYKTLPAFADVATGLPVLQRDALTLYAFSNGNAEMVTGLLQHAGIDEHFQGVVSVQPVSSYKPDPAVYRYFLDQAQVSADEAWMVSSNPFDVMGAKSAGMRAIWVRRDASAVFDPWEITPDAEVASIAEIADIVKPR
ncbi:MAG TPA: haloacid dehalogenase type II [Gammaproteobacteria bacterium]|nr:haloacid dehalogenase type II [Gammaproteobacteria bacterium]